VLGVDRRPIREVGGDVRFNRSEVQSVVAGPAMRLQRYWAHHLSEPIEEFCASSILIGLIQLLSHHSLRRSQRSPVTFREKIMI
jgi:hypothetical protein